MNASSPSFDLPAGWLDGWLDSVKLLSAFLGFFGMQPPTTHNIHTHSVATHSLSEPDYMRHVQFRTHNNCRLIAPAARWDVLRILSPASDPASLGGSLSFSLESRKAASQRRESSRLPFN
ncbi:uncharacterized protein Dana_GF26613, isoform B [Drosophila ananassae]|uniref:Uncharacterized protein, isoform B n=1 Tax=Drosophila ananassae TaxID=7217 RepID=A0A0P9BM19_DROAN|nr:uncharacterized protein Dana_GF26613, isoform B [Drosophila ananassae]